MSDGEQHDPPAKDSKPVGKLVVTAAIGAGSVAGVVGEWARDAVVDAVLRPAAEYMHQKVCGAVDGYEELASQYTLQDPMWPDAMPGERAPEVPRIQLTFKGRANLEFPGIRMAIGRAESTSAASGLRSAKSPVLAQIVETSSAGTLQNKPGAAETVVFETATATAVPPEPAIVVMATDAPRMPLPPEPPPDHLL